MLKFLLGLIIGSSIGVFTMAVIQINRGERNAHQYNVIRQTDLYRHKLLCGAGKRSLRSRSECAGTGHCRSCNKTDYICNAGGFRSKFNCHKYETGSINNVNLCEKRTDRCCYTDGSDHFRILHQAGMERRCRYRIHSYCNPKCE